MPMFLVVICKNTIQLSDRTLRAPIFSNDKGLPLGWGKRADRYYNNEGKVIVGCFHFKKDEKPELINPFYASIKYFFKLAIRLILSCNFCNYQFY
jgi:hypothetical protein